MRWKTALILMAVAAACTLLNLVLLRGAEYSMTARAREGMLVPFSAGDVKRFVLVRGAERIELAAGRDGAWDVTVPYADRAGREALEALRALCSFARGNPAGADAVVPEGAPVLTLETEKGNFSIAFGPVDSAHSRRPARVGGAGGALHWVDASLSLFPEWTADQFRERAIFGDLPEQAVEIHLTGTRDGTLTLVREGRAWRLDQPAPWPAHPAKVERLVRSCMELRAEGIMAERIPDRSAVGFEENGPGIQIRTLSGRTARVLFAEALDNGGGALCLADGRTALFRVPEALKNEIRDSTADAWRSRMVNLLDGTGDLSQLEIKAPRGVIRFEFTGGSWHGVAPVAFPVDPQGLAEFTKALGLLTVRRFVAESPDDVRYGFGTDGIRVSLTGADGIEKASLQLGGDAGSDERFARIGNRPQVFTLPAAGVKFLSLPWFAWRDRTVARFDWRWPKTLRIIRPAGETRYERVRGDMWVRSLPAPETPADTLRLYSGPLGADGLGNLTAVTWVAEKPGNPADFGLDQPLLRVVVGFDSIEGRLPPPLELDIGRPTAVGERKGYYARSRVAQGSPELVFFMADTIVRMLDLDYAGGTEAAEAPSVKAPAVKP